MKLKIQDSLASIFRVGCKSCICYESILFAWILYDMHSRLVKVITNTYQDFEFTGIVTYRAKQHDNFFVILIKTAYDFGLYWLGKFLHLKLLYESDPLRFGLFIFVNNSPLIYTIAVSTSHVKFDVPSLVNV